MKSIKISLESTESVKNFVVLVNKYPFEMDLKSDRFVIDAKSLLGIFSLDLSKPVTLEIHNEDSENKKFEALMEDLKKGNFIIK